MFSDYKIKQPVLYDFIVNSVNNNKISHAYMIESNGVSYAYDLALELAKFFMFGDNIDEKVNDEINNGVYSDLFVINKGQNLIKIDDIEMLKNSFSVKSYNDNYRVYIINNADLMNESSSNKLLKFLEEPDDNIIAILVVDSVYRVIDTIVSRCLILSLIPDFTNLDNVFDSMYDGKSNRDEYVHDELKKIIDFYILLEENGFDSIGNGVIYSYKESIKNVFFVGLVLYYDVLNMYNNTEIINYINGFDKEKEIIMKNNSFDVIIKKISLINEFVINSYENVNRDLLIDDFIIKMAGVDLND